MAFEKSPGWTKLICAGKRVVGFASPDATGSFEVRCTATRCKRSQYDTIHLFNLATGEHVSECVPSIEQADQPDSGSN